MASTTVVFGMVLVVLGLAGYLSSSGGAPTALIPAFFGLALVICGVMAHREATKKAAMHVAVGLGLLGCLGAFRGVTKLPSLLNGSAERPLAIQMQVAMFAICVLYVWLCIRSFQEARRARTTNPS